MSSPPRNPILRKGHRLCDPVLVKQAFTDDPAIFQAGEANAPALGEHSLLTLDRDRHLSYRKLLVPPSHGESVRRYADVLTDAMSSAGRSDGHSRSGCRCTRSARSDQ
jgi:cytochrome P450